MNCDQLVKSVSASMVDELVVCWTFVYKGATASGRYLDLSLIPF